MPPLAQSLTWIFIESPGPVRERTSDSRSLSTETSLVNASPRWSGILLAKTIVGSSPVRSRGFGAPVSVQSRTPKVAESTVNTTYLPFTRNLLPTVPAGTVVFWLPAIPSTENPPPSHPADEAANAARGVEKNDNAPHAPAATTYPSIRLLIRASRVSPTRVRQRRAGRRGNFLRDDGHASVRPRRGPRSAQRAVHDPDGGHHAFVLVLEDVAVEYEAAELRSVELDHHQHAGPRRPPIVVVQHVPVDRRGPPPLAAAFGGGRAPPRPGNRPLAVRIGPVGWGVGG